MHSVARALVASLAVLSAAAPAAWADTLPGRDSPFTPSQAVADQYLTAPANPRQASPAGVGAVGGVVVVAGDEPSCNVGTPARARAASHGCTPESGVAADDTGRTPVAGQAPALVERGATAPGPPGGTLPFTGSDLLALVWIALALVAAGTVIEVARRRLEAARARAGV